MYEFLEGSEKVKAGQGLKKNVRRIFFRHKVNACAKGAGCAAAALLIAVTVIANVSPDMAYAMADIPVLGAVVRVVTLDRYHKTIGGSEADIVTPELQGLADSELMEKINKELGDNANQLRQEFERDAKELAQEYGADAHMGIVYDYTVRTDTDDYYAVDIYFLNVAGSSSTTHKFYTIDRKTKELVTLGGLFAEGADYKDRLYEIIRAEMIRRNNEEGGMFFVEPNEFSDDGVGVFDSVWDKKAEQNFYINNDGELVICFDKYEVAAGAQGSPEFVIPRDKIADILKD